MTEMPPASQVPRHRGSRPAGNLVLRVLAYVGLGAIVLFLAGSGLYIFQQSRDRGLPMFSFGLPLGDGGSTGPGANPLAHQSGPCTSCHKSVTEQARLYLAINGRDVSDSPSVNLRAGEAFDLAYHFEGMAGARGRGVGTELVLPQGMGWSVGQGSGKPVDGWNETGTGRTFWSPAWSKADSGSGRRGGRWNPISGQTSSFYVEFGSRPRMPPAIRFPRLLPMTTPRGSTWRTTAASPISARPATPST